MGGIHRTRFRTLRTAVSAAVLLLSAGCRNRQTHANQDLIRALSDRDAATAQRALTAGADARSRETIPAPFDPQHRGHTALYLACRVHDRALLVALLQHGADPNERYEAGGTPLMQAVGLDNPEAAEVLLQHGAQVGARSSDGSTALHYSCLLPTDRLARLLVAHGADVNARDNAGHTPLALAKIRRNQVVARYLQSVGSKE